MAFIAPSPDVLDKLSVQGLTELAAAALSERETLHASINVDDAEDANPKLDQIEAIDAFVADVNARVAAVNERKARHAAAAPVLVKPEGPADKPADEAVTAAGVTDVADEVVTAPVAGEETKVVSATVTAASTRRTSVADVAAHAGTPDIRESDDEPYTIVAAAATAVSSTNVIPAGSKMTWKDLGKAFVEATQGHEGMVKGGARGRQQNRLAVIRRNMEAVTDSDTHEQAYGKLSTAANDFARNGIQAAIGWCAPSEPDYSICSPITADGLFNAPERVLRRGGLIHNQGLDFGDFFGDDFVLPIPGYNVLTEAQVIADTAKTCVEIPCPAFVDDRLNVAALCLTGSLLQNRGYPEFVSTFVEGSVMAMAHLVNREIINAIVTGSTAITLTTVDPWATDGTVWSQVMSLIDFAATDLRYVYRARRDQMVEFVLPEWLRPALRADYIRGNARANDDLADEAINAALTHRRAQVQWVYDWQDAFNPTGGADANHSMGDLTPTDLFNVPLTLQVLAYLPGTWLIGRQDVIRLDTVYDSTNLAQNQVTQLFMEDGFLPMRMCQHSRVYTVPICANGSTGVQRAVTCADILP